MITPIIEKVISFKARPTAFEEMLPGTVVFRSPDGNSDNLQTGSVSLLVSLERGTFDEVSDVMFLSGNPMTGKVQHATRLGADSYEVRIDVNAAFFGSFKSGFVSDLEPGTGLIGYSDKDKDRLNTFEGQQRVLETLLDFIFPAKKRLVLNLSRKCLLMQVSSSAKGTLSRFGGPAAMPSDQPVPVNDNAEGLSHILTLNISEVLMAWPECKIGKFGEYLSLLLTTSDLDQRWPDQVADRAILRYDSRSESKSRRQEAIGVPIRFQPFLDLPYTESAIIDTVKFSEDEMEIYEAIREIYMTFVLGDSQHEDKNKLFGYSDSLQMCPVLEAEMESKKTEYADLDLEEALKWRQLFQLATSDKSLEYSDPFGGAMIFVMIRKDDLEEGNFKNVQVVVQNT